MPHSVSPQIAVAAETNQHVVERLTSIGAYEWRLSPERMTWPDQVFRIFGYQPGEVEPSILLGTAQDITRQPVRSRELAAYESVAKTLASWESRDDPLGDVLGGIATSLEQSVAALWVPDDEAGVRARDQRGEI